MAKTKKEEIIDLKPEKISEEQLKEIQDVVNSINRAQMKLNHGKKKDSKDG